MSTIIPVGGYGILASRRHAMGAYLAIAAGYSIALYVDPPKRIIPHATNGAGVMAMVPA